MSTYFTKGLSDRQVEYIQTRLRYESYYKTIGYSWMYNYGYIKPMPIGLKEVKEFILKETEAGDMGFTPEAFRSYTAVLEGKEYKVLLIGKILEFGKRDIQAWMNNSSNIGKETTLEAATIAEFQQKLYLQMDGFTFWGTNMKEAVATNPWKGTNEITGMFNGFTTFGAGADEDNNVNAAYDYYISMNNAVEDLRNEGFEADSYTVFSSIPTKKDCDGNSANHRLATYGFETELKAILAKPEIKRWKDSPACVDYATTANRMCVVPNIKVKANVLGSDQQMDRSTPFCIYQEPIQVEPLYGGTWDKRLKRSVVVYTALAWAQTNTKAIVRSGDLTFTAPG